MSNIKQFNTPNGEKVGLNLTQIGTYIEVDGTEKELKQYIDENAGGGSEITQNYKGLITDPNTELTKTGDLGYYNEVSGYAVKYSKYFTFPEKFRNLILKTPSGLSQNFLRVQKIDIVYNLYINTKDEYGDYNWVCIQENLQDLPELTKIPFTYIFYDETLSQDINFNGEFAWSLTRQEIYYTVTIDGWIPELKMKGMTEWNEGIYDITEPEDVSKKQGSIYVKDSNGNVINTNSIKKVVEIKGEWNGWSLPEEYISEVSAAYNEIKEGIENRYEVVVFTNFNEYGKVQLTDIKETNEIDGIEINGFDIRGFISDNIVLKITIGWTGNSANKQWVCVFNQYTLLTNNDIPEYVASVYEYDSIVNLKRPSKLGPVYVYQFVNKSFVNEDFYVVKTTVPKWDGTTSFYDDIYKGVLNNGYEYYITKFSGFRIDNEDTFTSEFDLLPDGQWYIIGAEINFDNKLNYCLVAKTVVTDNGNLDVYFGAYASNDYLSMISVSTVTDYVENYVTFYDCTVNNKFEQGNGGRRSEKNWVVVGTEKIKVDAFDALATYRFIPNPAVEGQNIRVRCFKRR